MQFNINSRHSVLYECTEIKQVMQLNRYFINIIDKINELKRNR